MAESISPLYIGDTIFLSLPQTGEICLGDGLLDCSVELSSAKDEQSLGLFKLARAQTVNSSEVSGKLKEADSQGQERVTFGVDLLLRHLHSGAYLSIDPFNSVNAAVKLAPISEMCRVRLMPQPNTAQTVDSEVDCSIQLLLLFTFKKLQFSLSVEGKRLGISLQAQPWKLTRAFVTEAYPRITPYSFVHLRHATLPVFICEREEGLVGESSPSHLGTYWQLEPSSSLSTMCKLKNLYTQRYLSAGEDLSATSLNIITSAYEGGAYWYQTSFQLAYKELILGVSQKQENSSVAVRLLNPSLTASKIEIAFGGTRTYLQFHPVESEQGQLVNRVCRIVNILKHALAEPAGHCTKLQSQFSAALTWVETNIPMLKAFLWESGFFGVLVQALFRVASSYTSMLPQDLSKLVSRCTKVLLDSLTRYEICGDYLTPHFAQLLWLRHSFHTPTSDPQFNLNLLTRLLLDSEVLIGEYPLPQSGREFKATEGNPVTAWLAEIDYLSQENAEYQSLVLRLLNHMICSRSQYSREWAREVAGGLDRSKLPTFHIEGECVYVCFPAPSREAFFAQNPKLRALAYSDLPISSDQVAVAMTKIWTKDELYWRYVDQAIRLLGFTQEFDETESPQFTVNALMAILKESSHVKTMRSCLRVLGVVLFQPWRRVPLAQVFAVSPQATSQSPPLPTMQVVLQLRRFLVELLDSESFSDTAAIEHTNSVLLVESLLQCFVRMVESYYVDAGFIHSLARLSGMLFAGFGVETRFGESWVAREIAECLRTGFTAKRQRTLQRLFRTSAHFLERIIHTQELCLIWKSLESSLKKEPMRQLTNERITETFAVPSPHSQQSVAPTSSSPLVPKTSQDESHRKPQTTLMYLTQKLIFMHHKLVGAHQASMLSLCEKMAALSGPLAKILNSISRANEAEVQVIMDLMTVEAQAIDESLESGDCLSFEAASTFVEKMTDVLSGSQLKKVAQRVVKLMKVSNRVREIKRLSKQFSTSQQAQLLYLESLFFSKSTPPRTLSHKRQIDLSAVHLSPVCNLIFSMRDVLVAGMDDRILCVNWVMEQPELRSMYFLKKLVAMDFDRLENALLVSDRLIDRVTLILSSAHPSSRETAELAVCFHLLSLCCCNSQLILGQVEKAIPPNKIERVIKHPLVLSGYFELVLAILQKEDSLMLRDYLSIAVTEVQGVIREIVYEKALSLGRVADSYDHALRKDEPIGRRKKKNELVRLEDGSRELHQWKMLLNSDKLVSKGIISVMTKSFAAVVERKSLWRELERLKPELRELIFCVIEAQKSEPTLSFDRLTKKARLCLDLLEQKKSSGYTTQFASKFIMGLSKKKMPKAELFPIELADGTMELEQAEVYTTSLYSHMHGATYGAQYMQSFQGLLKKLSKTVDADEFFGMLRRVGVLGDLCEAASSSDVRLCQMALSVLGTLLKQCGVATRNEFRAFLEASRMHGSFLAKFCELLSAVSSQAAAYGEKCQRATDAGQDPNSVIVSESFYERLEIVVEFLRLLQVCCDLCNESFQTFLGQWPYSGSESVVWNMGRALCELRKSMGLFIHLKPESPEQTVTAGTFDTETVHFTFSLGEEVCKFITALLETLQETVTGPCKSNQVLLSKNSHMLLALNQLMRSAIRQNAEIYGRTVILLLALLEGEPQAEVIDRITQVINLRLFLDQIREKFCSLKEDEDPGDSFVRLFIFLMKLKQWRPTHELLAQISSSPSYTYFITKTGYVEVMKDGEIEGIYFPVPERVRHMTLRSREAVIWDIDRSTQMNQINEFMQKIKVWNYEMEHQMRINSHRYIKFFTAQWSAAGMISFCLVVLINMCMLWDITSAEELLDGNNLPRRTFYTLMGVVQTVMGCIQYIFYYVEYYPNMIYEDDISRKDILKGLVVEQPLSLPFAEKESAKEETRTRIDYVKVLFWRFETVRFVGYVTCSLLAFSFPFCYGILLLDIVRKNSGLHTVLQSITINKGRLLLTFCLGMLIVYIFSIFAFIFLTSELDGMNGINCQDMLHCFTSLFGVGVKSQGEMLNGPDPSSALFLWRMLFDVSFFILVIVILLNISFGVILNTFAQMRDERNEMLLDIYSRCYICGHHRSEINLRGSGWRNHLVGEHSPFAYIAFFVYLDERRGDECSGLEKYVKDMYESKNYSFMPTNPKRLQDIPDDHRYE